MINRLYNYLKHLGKKLRKGLTKRPVLYTLIGSFATVLFWRGVWHTTDLLEAQGGVFGFLFSAHGSLILSAAILIVTGLFVSFFVGDVVILAGMSKEQKLLEKAEKKIEEDSVELKRVEALLERVEEEVSHLHRVHRETHPHKARETAE